jgi:acetyl-CoA C-acetyltransferase
MSEAFVFDAIRTPRGKGKKDGSLHEVKPINLLAGLLTELQRRNDLDTAQVDDIVMGIVAPMGEQGSVLPKVAALKAGWDFQCAGVQLNRFCASGLEAVNMAAQKVRSGWEDLVVAGGVESMSRVPIGSDGGAWAMDPETNSKTTVRAAGHRRRPDRHDGRLQPRGCRCLRARIPEARDGRTCRGPLRPLGGAGDRLAGPDHPGGRRIHQTAHHDGRPGCAEARVRPDGRDGLRPVALQRYPQVERIQHVHHAGNSSGIVDGAAALLIGNEAAAKTTTCSRAHASSRWRCRAPTRPSCSPARCPPRARRWPRPA